MTEIAKAALSAKGTVALTVRPVTINQVVAYNMAWYRKAAGLTQEDLGQRLGGWTKVAVSAAERSWDGKRVRKFDADDLVAIARAIGVPVPALFLPPDDAGIAITYELEETSEVEQRTQLTALLPYFLPSSGDQTPVMAAFRNRLMALGAKYLTETDHAEAIIADSRTRADSLERDAVERHRTILSALIIQRDELEHRVDELRRFEREYRSRLLAYMESQISTLRSEVGDERKFVLRKGSGGKYHFNLVAANGQVVATSQSYERKKSALNGIESVKNSASYADIDDQTGE